MDYTNLTKDIWKNLRKSKDNSVGYEGIWLSRSNGENSSLHIFKDESEKYHFIIEDTRAQHAEIEDPNINGLTIRLNEYYINRGERKKVIDIQCNLSYYIEEFNEIVKEIARAVLDDKEIPSKAVNRVIRKWKVFWSKQQRHLLTDEEVIGLYCELLILKKLCLINNASALNSWTGPSHQRHDFIFLDWSLEIKGTRANGHSHTINGIDQLKPFDNKSLAFVSTIVSVTNNNASEDLQSVIESIVEETLVSRPDLIIKFNELLSLYGYSPLYAEEYRKFKIVVIESYLYIVDESFPKLTSDNLATPLNSRVTSVRYNISLDGMSGIALKDVKWGDFFY